MSLIFFSLFFGQADLLDETGASPVHLGILSGNPDTVGVFVAAGLVTKTKFNPTSNLISYKEKTPRPWEHAGPGEPHSIDVGGCLGKR